MSSDHESSRREFEAWASRHGFDGSKEPTGDADIIVDGVNYTNGMVYTEQDTWDTYIAWIDARKRPDERIKELEACLRLAICHDDGSKRDFVMEGINAGEWDRCAACGGSWLSPRDPEKHDGDCPLYPKNETRIDAALGVDSYLNGSEG